MLLIHRAWVPSLVRELRSHRLYSMTKKKKIMPTYTTCHAAKSLQSCPTLCDPIDGSPPGSPIPGILQTRTLEWVAISFSNVWKWRVRVKLLSCVQLFVTPWTGSYQAPPPLGFSRQEYWSGVPLPSPLRAISMAKMKVCLYQVWVRLWRNWDLHLLMGMQNETNIL